jgi:hypothetical protein
MFGVQLGLDAVDQLEHVFTIAGEESQRSDRVVHGRECPVYGF